MAKKKPYLKSSQNYCYGGGGPLKYPGFLLNLQDFYGSFLNSPAFRLYKVDRSESLHSDIHIFLGCLQIEGSLESSGTQMGYAIRVLIWVVVEINDQTIFWSILLSRRCQPGLPN